MYLLDNSDSVVIFSGCVAIAAVCQARDDIRAALGRGQSLVLDVDAVTETDLSFVQLVESARRKAGETGYSFKLRHPAAGAILEVLRRGGFLDDETSDRARFWLQGAAQ
jgi:hypothetical protein